MVDRSLRGVGRCGLALGRLESGGYRIDVVRRLTPIALIGLTGAVSLATIVFPAGNGAGVELRQIASLPGATSAAAVPGDPTALAIATRSGVIRLLRGGTLTPALDDVSRGVGATGRVLSLAFAPDYPLSGLYYVYAVDRNGALAIWQRHVPGGARHAEPRGRGVLSFTSERPVTAGQIAFGPDGLLWIGTPDPSGREAQRTGSLLGKLLRIDPGPSRDGASFTVPRDQAGVTPDALPTIFARGLKDPRSFSFDAATGALTLVDDDELNRVNVSDVRGANFEWSCGSATPCGGSFLRPSIHRHGLIAAVQAPDEFGDGTIIATASELRRVLPGPDGTRATSKHLLALDDARALVANANGGIFVIDGRGTVSQVVRAGTRSDRPIARIRVSDVRAAPGSTVALDGARSSGASLRYAWDTDGDGSAEGTRSSIHVHVTARPRTITLTIDDGDHTSRRSVVLPARSTAPLDLQAPSVVLRAIRTGARRVRVAIRSSEGGRTRVWATISRQQAAAVGITSTRLRVEVVSRTVLLAQGRHAVELVLPARVARAHGARVTISARVVDAAGNAARRRVLLAGARP